MNEEVLNLHGSCFPKTGWIFYRGGAENGKPINGNALSASVNEIRYANSESLFDDAKAIIEESRSFAQKAVNVALLRRNWLLGKRIVEEELNSENRAEYGKQVIKTLSK